MVRVFILPVAQTWHNVTGQTAAILNLTAFYGRGGMAWRLISRNIQLFLRAISPKRWTPG
jgi:hypothetical protein